MPLILIKNYLKLMLRNKGILLMMIVFPIITIALLSNAFRDMLDTVHKVDNFQVGYRVSEDTNYQAMFPQLKTICEENGVTLLDYPDGDIDQLMKDKTVAVFVDITATSYSIYQSGDKKIEAAITESIFSSFFYEINSSMTEMTYSVEHGNTALKEVSDAQVISEKLNTDPVAPSDDYYGIIYIVYGTLWGMIILVSVISSERKGSVLKRMRISHMSKFNQYIGRFIPGFMAIFIEVCLAWVVTALLLDIHWGNIPTSVLIILLTSMATAAFGILLFQLFKNVAVAIVIGFIVSWVLGFFGGSFQSYMYNPMPQRLTDMSPIYYVNRTLVEFSIKGHSSYTGTCIIFLIAIIMIVGFIDVLLMGRKLEEQ